MNCGIETQKFQVFGNYFELKPGALKLVQENVAKFVDIERKELGIVTLPESLEDPDFKASPEGKALLESKRKEGVDARCKKLEWIVYNLQVSLRQDLERANIKADPRGFASDGELAAMEELAKFRANKADETEIRIKRIKDLEDKLKK